MLFKMFFALFRVYSIAFANSKYAILGANWGQTANKRVFYSLESNNHRASRCMFWLKLPNYVRQIRHERREQPRTFDTEYKMLFASRTIYVCRRIYCLSLSEVLPN